MNKLKILLIYISSNRVWIITLACLDLFFIFLAWLANPDYFINYAAFYAGDVGYKRVGLNVLLIFLYPLDERMRIHCKNQQVKLPDVFGVDLGSAVLYYPLAQGIVYRLLPPCDGADLKAVRGERLGVAAAHKAKAEYKYFRVFIKLHILPPNRWS